MNIKLLLILVPILIGCKAKKQAPLVIPCPTIPDSTIVTIDTIRDAYLSIDTKFDTIIKDGVTIIKETVPPIKVVTTVTKIKHYENTTKLDNANFKIDSLKEVINELSNMRLEVQSKLDNSKGQIKTLRLVLLGCGVGILSLFGFLFFVSRRK